MPAPRTLLLYDPNSQPSSWNERMAPGEFAVLYSSQSEGTLGGPVCTVFDSLPEAESHAAWQIAQTPYLRCRIYDHHGLGSQPVRELRGADFKGESEISARFRRGAGAILFFGGLTLLLTDWSVSFRLGWAATLGARMLPVGLILGVTELAIVLTAQQTATKKATAP